MKDAAFESSENSLARHNEWVGQSVKLSAHKSPEVEELVDADLAERQALNLLAADKVRSRTLKFRCFDT